VLAKLKRFNWRRSILWFLFPIASYSIVVFIGIVLKEGAFDKFDNAATMIMATLFDLPAVFVFSFTFIFMEEIIFRGILLNSHLSTKKETASAITVSVLFSIYSMPDVFTNDFSSLVIYISLLFYFFSVSFITSFLALRYDSLWVSYSFRIGLLTIAPLILTSYMVESDSLFQTKNSFFYAEGFLFSLLTLVTGFVLLKRRAEIPLEPQIVEKSTI
ncbi:MAG: CPBP family intramembrane glutamic endopeptidase, partial [Bacteroidota bacterium]